MILDRVKELSFDLRYISDLANSTPGCLRADLGELNYELPPIIGELIREIADDSRAFSYAPTFGDPELLDKLKGFNHPYFPDYDGIKTLVTSGGQAALFAVFHSVIRSGDRILTDRHFYPPYSNLAKLRGSQLVPGDMSQPESLEEDDIRMLIVNSPSNPTGKIYRRKILEDLANKAQKNNWIVLEDVVYDRIYFDDPPTSISEFCPERTLVINSASKNFCMPGARIGWLTGPEELVVNIAKLHRNMNSCPNAFFQKLIARFIPYSAEFFEGLRTEMKVRRDLLLSLFDELGWQHSRAEGAIYAMAKVPGLEDSISFVERLIAEAKISVMPGSYFGGHDDQLRFCYGALSRSQIEELKKRITRFLDSV